MILLGGRIQGYSRGLEEIAEDDLCAGLVWIILESVFSNFVDVLSRGRLFRVKFRNS